MSFSLLNALGKKREPFLFISDFKGENIEVILPQNLDNEDIAFSIEKSYRYKYHNNFLDISPINFKDYNKKFIKVIEKIKSGETYVLNLTQATRVKSSLDLSEIFQITNAHYKLYYKNQFVCFSPETFIQISQDTIHTFPMKGTIDASIPNAKEKILQDTKELSEHVMIVDLLRNDLSIVAKSVQVERFRYITELETGKNKLLQVSSHISGKLEPDWHENIGSILKSLLPAGSISGTPKKSTVEIIENIEGYKRNYFSGVFGYYNGETLDSGVMIRFIEKSKNGYIYKSGGGITLDSNAHLEYNELLNKIYLP